VIDSIAHLDALATRCPTALGADGGARGDLLWRLWGAGPPVVLFHGGSGSWTHWARNIMPLARYFTVWAPDLPGFGDSGMPPGEMSADTMADVVSSGLDDVVTPPTPVDLIGFSFGAIIAGMVAARQGARVRTLVLLGTGGLGLPTSAIPPLARVASDMTVAELRTAHRRNLAAVMIADPAKVDDAAVDAQMENVRRARFKIGDIPTSDDLLRALPRVRARVVALWGDRDVFAGTSIERRRAVLRAVDPDVDVRVIAGTGHWANWETADVFNTMLLDVLGVGAPAWP